ncbi:nuclear transport factor 2 family protein [Nocardioides anomalus]|uniref:Nuclear transport factor 2 family protein n=1 Tax=Nocardioides anomalus TaxID=2712223 RepID=A0A6G6WBX4_9ACTN|nr:nuclear transport factor 2 family protein [Nocardioides anomalus]QIG42742.1 nuclear transport factor 2 family protein [Nocardioides anomalus]
MSTPRELAETYFAAWQARDAAALRAVLADDVTFAGPMATLEGADAAVEGLMGLAAATTRLDVLARVDDGDDVITWFEFTLGDRGPVPTANWSHVEDGRIAAVRVTFDPRPILEQDG